MKKVFVLLCTLLLAPVWGAGYAAAAEHEDVRRAVIAGRYKPLAEILSYVQKRYEGRVLDVELEREPGGLHIYEVKLLDANGRRQEIHIDAVTGKEVQLKSKPRYTSLPKVLRKILETHPGQVVDVDLKRDDQVEGEDARGIYQIRIQQDNGEVRSIFIDAISGELISNKSHIESTKGMKPLPDLLDALLETYPGHVLEAELKYDRELRPFFEIDLLLNDGRMTELWVDPMTGRVMSEDEMEIR